MNRRVSPEETAGRVQVAALPIRFDESGNLLALLVTSRETKRWIIPKGWPMKGRKPWQAAAREALEEAGVVGRARKKRAGKYTYFKRQKDRFDVCRVDVFVLEFAKQLKSWREKGQRESRWLGLAAAAEMVEEPGLVALLKKLAERLPVSKRLKKSRKSAAPPAVRSPLAAEVAATRPADRERLDAITGPPPA